MTKEEIKHHYLEHLIELYTDELDKKQDDILSSDNPLGMINEVREDFLSHIVNTLYLFGNNVWLLNKKAEYVKHDFSGGYYIYRAPGETYYNVCYRGGFIQTTETMGAALKFAKKHERINRK